MKSKKFFSLSAVLAAAVALSLVGCGKDTPAAAASGESGALTPDRSITVAANDQMQFDVATIEVTAGEVISLTLNNEGTMPKFSMGHNLLILKAGTDEEAFVEAAMNASTSDYVPESMESSIVATTKLLGGGESDTIVFKVPSKKGVYPFICSFPGHFQVGMRGDFIVR